MKRSPWSAVAIVTLGLCAGLGFAACGDSAGPGESLCERLNIRAHSFAIDFAGECNSFESTLSDMQYNQYGEVTAFDFDVRCATSSERYTGRVWDIRLQDHTTVVAWRAEINGQSCRFGG